MTSLSAYGLLLLTAFLSATVLPGSSEVALVGFLASAKGTPAFLIAVATIGNVAGSCVNWYLGCSISRLKGHRWFPLSNEVNRRAQNWFSRYGIWSLLLSWVPIVGDPLTLIAGVLRVPFLHFVVLVAVGKGARYILVVLAWQNWAYF